MGKVVIKYDKPTSRMKYSADVLFNTCLGVEVEWSSGGEANQYVLSTGKNHLTCPVHSISLSKDSNAVSSGINRVSYKGEMFPCEVIGDADINFDPLAATLFFVARWEEVYLSDSNSLDKHGRFKGKKSSSYLQGVLDRPSVDIMARILAEVLELEFTEPKYSFQPSIDIDVAYKYLGRPLWKSVLLSIKDILTFKNPHERMNVVSTGNGDPFDTYDYIESLHSSNGLKTTYYVLRTERKKPYDVCLSKPVIDNLIEKLLKSSSVYWHPSYEATENMGDVFSSEKNEFTADSDFVRHHFLKSGPTIWPELEANNVKRDSSLAYADLPGFRAGICREYNAYDLKSEKALHLKILPPAIMDSTLHSYMNLRPDKAINVAQEIITEVKAVGGTLVTIWHNTSVSNVDFWKGWRKVYEEVVRRSIP